jgi:hypothetical protein
MFLTIDVLEVDVLVVDVIELDVLGASLKVFRLNCFKSFGD